MLSGSYLKMKINNGFGEKLKRTKLKFGTSIIGKLARRF